MRTNPDLKTVWRRHAQQLTRILGAFTIAFICTLGVERGWARAESKPTVHLLGSGNRLSLLITAGNARVLIASGNDATAFGNALAQARQPLGRRIDVAILVGTEADAPVARHVGKSVNARQRFVVDGPLVAFLPDLGLTENDVIARATRIRLPGGIELTVTPESAQSGEWSAIISRGSTTIYAGNSRLPAPSLVDGVSIAIFAGDFDPESLAKLDTSAIALTTGAIQTSKLRDSADQLGFAGHALRVETSHSSAVKFVTGGIAISGNAIELGAAPNP